MKRGLPFFFYWRYQKEKEQQDEKVKDKKYDEDEKKENCSKCAFGFLNLRDMSKRRR